MKNRATPWWLCLAGLITLAGLLLNVFPVELPGEWGVGTPGPPTEAQRMIGQLHILLQHALLYGGGLALAILAAAGENRRSERAVREALERLEA